LPIFDTVMVIAEDAGYHSRHAVVGVNTTKSVGTKRIVDKLRIYLVASSWLAICVHFDTTFGKVLKQGDTPD